MILTSFAAKKRPGHACSPWPNAKCSALVDTNWALFSLPGSDRILRNRRPSHCSGSLCIFESPPWNESTLRRIPGSREIPLDNFRGS